MSDRDFFREVDEAVRQDRYKQLWDQYGIYAIGAAAAVVLAVAGHKAWTYWQDKQAQEAGAKFTQALSLEDGPEAATAREMLAAMAEKGPEGYRMLARFQLAAAEAKAGELDKAVAAYDALAKDPSVRPVFFDAREAEAAYFRKARIIPIMQVLVIRRSMVGR